MSSTPLLVYNRIDRNRRTTRVLVAAFSMALLPCVSAGAVLVVPFVALAGGVIAFMMYGRALAASLESLEVPARTGSLHTVADLPQPLLVIIGVLLAVALLLSVVALIAATAYLISRYGARLVLRLARARPVGRDAEPALWRTVENLCIGAGLPMPSLHLIESPAPNALATGRDPQSAALVVTRGLITLLDARELQGVIAHELSHIGNHDIRLTTTLTALVGTLSLPFRVVTTPIRKAFQSHWTLGLLAASVYTPLLASLVFTLWGGSSDGDPLAELPLFIGWWALHATFAPVYALFVAPLIGLVIRQAVSRQREFLADADAALLTRDPIGLALALAKIGAARGDRLLDVEACVHLYCVDPQGERGSLLHWLFPSHPPLQQRIDLLARMGA